MSTTLNTKKPLDDEETNLKTSGEVEDKLSNVIDKLNKKNEPEGGWKEEDLLKEARAYENEPDVIRGIKLISDLVSEELSIDDGELMEKMKESGISHEDAQTALTKAFENSIIVAEEEGMGTVSGPADTMSANDPQFRKKEKDDTFVLPSSDGEEGNLKNSLADKTRRRLPKSGVNESDGLDDEMPDPMPFSDKDNEDMKKAGDRLEKLAEVNESDSIMLNENYIEYDDLLYRPRYTSEEAWSDDLIFENKFYTSEGVGNCQFCKGAGKITVERLGLKECPDCDGTGDVQGDPMAQMNPMDPNAQVDPNQEQMNPEEISPEQPEITGQPVEQQVPQQQQLPNQVIQQGQSNGMPAQVPPVKKKPNPFAKGESKKKATERTAWIMEQCKKCEGTGRLDDYGLPPSQATHGFAHDSCDMCSGTGEREIEIQIPNTFAPDGSIEPSYEAKLKDGYIKCSKCDQQFSDIQWVIDHEKEVHGESKKKAREEGTSAGAKKGWDTRGRGGASQDEPSTSTSEPSTSELKSTIDSDDPYVVYKDYGLSVASYADYKEAVKHSDEIGGSVSDNSDEGNILYFAKGWDGQPDTHKGSKTVAPRKQLPRFTAQRDIHSMGSTDSGGIGEIPAGVQHSKKETLKHFAKIQEREKDTYEYNTNDHTKQYYYQFEADDLDYFSDEELYSTVGAGSNSDLCRALGITYPGMDNRWDQLTDEDHKKLGDAFRDNPVSQTNPNYNGWVETTVTFKSYPDNYVNASNLSADDAGLGVRTSNHEVRFHNRSLTRIVDDKADSYSEEPSSIDTEFTGRPGGESKASESHLDKICYHCGLDKDEHEHMGHKYESATAHNKASSDLLKQTESKKKCKPCRKTLAHEASVSKFESYVERQIKVLQKKAKAGEAVSLMYGLPTLSSEGKKIKGILAYAGVSLNDRIYLPEELAKGHGLTLPLLLNHSSIAGAEDELDRLNDEMLDCLYNETDYHVGEVTLTWEPEKLTLFYEGVIEDKFFQKEVDEMNMAVSLGIFYDSDSPRVCNDHCYTLIKGAEFREVSLVYHAGFPIATIEAVEAQLKKRSLAIIAKEDHFKKLADLQEDEQAEGDKESVKDIKEIVADVEEETTPKESEEAEVEEAVAEEEQDDLARGGSVDVEEKESGVAPTIDLKDDWHGQTIVTEMFTPDNFSVRGVRGMTISNANGVERYTFDPTLNFGTNTIHFDTYDTGATIYGETLQPKMGTPEDITKIIEAQPDIVVEDADKPAFESKKNQKK